MKKNGLLKIVVITTVIAFMVGLFGCAPAAVEETAAETEAPATEAAETEAAETEAVAAMEYPDLSGITINAIVETGPHGTGVREVAKGWMEKTGAKVNFTVLPGWPDIYEKVKLDLSSKTGQYDLLQVNWGWIPEIGKWLEPLDPLMEADKISYLDNDDFFESGVAGGQFDGKTVGTLLSAEWLSMVYRTDKFEEKGLAAPKTLDDLLAAAKALNDPDNDFYGFSGMGKKGEYPYWHYFWILSAMGGKIFDDSGNSALDPAANPVALDALNYMIELYKYTPPEALGWDHFTAYGSFSEGRTAMNVCWLTGQFENTTFYPDSKVNTAAGDELKFAVIIPSHNDDTFGHPFHGWYLALSPNSKDENQAAAWSLQKAVTFDSAFKETYTNAAWPCLSSKSQWELAKKTYTVAEQELAVGSTCIKEPQVSYYMEFGDKLGTEINAALTGVKTAEKALQDANSAIQELVDANK